jgi:diaminohydroxyphosphoribosylaminopyrimidine deaminase/5-amino-6-(5-phosphoribosylamino)uracil reductase
MTDGAGVAIEDEHWMRRAVELGQHVRTRTSPNPWVGAVVLAADGSLAGEGATAPPGGPHAEYSALAEAGERARGGTCFTTLEPCSTHGRTPPCADAIIAAGVRRVVVALIDPDDHVQGRGVARLQDSGIEVSTGVLADVAAASLRPYLVHRRTLRPYVVLKLAATLDGRIAAPDGTSKWITGSEARADVQQLRSESDAILVGAGTVRADDPELTVRTDPPPARQPLRVVLGVVGDGARVQPAVEMSGDIGGVLDELGRRGVLQLLVEGGASVAAEFHRRGAVDRYVVYMTAGFLGGDDGVGMFSGAGAATMGDLWRGRLSDVRRFGDDVRLDVEPLTGQ